ncbi:dipeptide ABC transporter ATP-binding protein [Pseudooceanicola algae]|uniref:Glutathione import ATP-binding protein GsiA n=1 Tax=Pseudooceanicola algae TaxID=1537215 RepID=A0A418SEN1_9RHOB|nr:ABC transporter ATP-binding protein [Pseudooceanicola algae]QPM89814.1 Glutathione import ATP-binding protein GsiA [Pseudooceanicola algae]
MPHLHVENLSVHYRDAAGRDLAAVDRLSFALERGETLGIVGESGSGKSTVARALLGFTRPGARLEGGQILLGGRDVLAFARKELRAYRGATAVMVPQNPLSSLTPHLTNGEQLVELIRHHDTRRGATARARALDLMAATGLPEPDLMFRRYPHEISGGQRQRLVIAAALVARPDLIVLDEPTTALDKTVEARVLDLVGRVQAELGATLIYVSHDLNVIAKLCQRVLVLKDGREVEAGCSTSVFDTPRTGYTRRLVASIPRLDQSVPRPPRPEGDPVLSADHLDFTYHRPTRFLRGREHTVKAVDDLSFAIRRGETLGVLGESGSGKSTMAGLVAGILSGNSGEIRLGETVVTGLARTRPQDVRRRIQMVFQDPLSSLNPAHNVEQTLIRPAQRYFGLTAAQARARAVSLLAELELAPEILARRPQHLSGGQQQRIAIARALIADPDVLICDEITSALDMTVQSQVLALLKRLQDQRGLALLFISHDLAVVARISDQILVLQQGQLRDHGPCDQVLAHPRHSYTKQLFAAFRRNEFQRSQSSPAKAILEPVG